jgi:serine/threonine protein kinase
MTDALDKTATSGQATGTQEPVNGGQLGKYKLLRMIGSGGMGNVWAAHDPDLDREIAIKLLRGGGGDQMRTRLLREARAMARLKHPNVLTVYEVGTVGDRDYIAMELVDGQSLDAWLDARPADHEVWDALLGAGKGLAAAHAADLVHRDFKPHNVLRSRDGRVLVTDFGLARGLTEEPSEEARAAIAVEATLPVEASKPGLEETVDAATTGRRGTSNATTGKRTDSVLHSPLTRTGQLLGTPAYMAPEQFAGAPTDARTDQFAYAVTAWQLLTGERPYRGDTLEELRKAASKGATRVDAKLPAAVKTVLVRALDPDPDKRWPDMPALLRALDRARNVWKRRLALVIPIVAVGLAALLAVKMFSGSKVVKNDSDCEPGERVFDKAWSPARATEISKRPGMAAAVKQMNGFRTRWLAAYDAACKLPKLQRPGAVNCLLTQSRFLSGFNHMFDSPKMAMSGIDFWGLFPNPDSCNGDHPVALANFGTEDPAKMQKGFDLIATSYGMLAGRRKELLAKEKELLAETRALGMPLIEDKVLHALGVAASNERDYPNARRLLSAAIDVAQQNLDYSIEAQARTGLLEISQDDIGDLPADSAFDDLFSRLKAAVHNVGDPEDMVLALDAFRATHALNSGKLAEAIDIFEYVFAAYEKVGLRYHTISSAEQLDKLLVARGEPADLTRIKDIDHELAVFVERPDVGKPSARELADAQYLASWVQHDLARVHDVLDKANALQGRPGPHVTGRVVGPDGKPAAGAHVVAWAGEMFGDGLRVYTTPAFASAEATTASDGSFALDVPGHGALIAELGTARSAPVAAADGIVLSLADTATVRGKIGVTDESALGLEVYARLPAGAGNAWFVTTAPAPDGSFELARVLPGMELGAFGAAWPREQRRRIMADADGTLRWPLGPTLDVVSASSPAGTAVYVLRGKVSPKTRTELDELTARWPDRAVAELGPVGWANLTEEGAKAYERGDRHAVIRDNAPGDVTICLAAHDPNAKLTCKQVVVPAAPASLHDARHWFPAVVVRM